MGHDILDYGNVPVMELQEIEEECLKMASTAGTSVRVSQTTSTGPNGNEWYAKHLKQVGEASKMVSN